MHCIHVMVAVLRDARGRVLINQRPAGKSHAGRWEFPGGKLESGEDRFAGLVREIREELGVEVLSANPLIRIRHQYSDLRVLLDVMECSRWNGEPVGKEGQVLDWVEPNLLLQHDILEADFPIIRAIRLPDRLLVTPGADDVVQFLESLDLALANGISMVQLREHELGDGQYRELAQRVLEQCRRHGAELILNQHPGILDHVDADGIHLGSRHFHALGSRPVADDKWFSVACHDRRDIELAESVGADFALLGSVKTTRTHPEMSPLGWKRFAALVDSAALPVYALGGMQPGDAAIAREHGGQGIAAIRSLWPGNTD